MDIVTRFIEATALAQTWCYALLALALLRPGHRIPPTLGRLAIRRALDELMAAWADALPSFADRTIAETAGRIALNDIQFSPPKFSAHLLLGTEIEGG